MSTLINLVDKFEEHEEERNKEAIRQQLAERRFDPQNPPVKPAPFIKIGEHTIGTLGNLVNIQAGVKAGKSATVGAIIAAAIKPECVTIDSFGIEVDNSDHKAVVHIDTEQSRYDAHWILSKALERSFAEVPPEWLYSYFMADLGASEKKKALEQLLEDIPQKHGGLFTLIIDGVADLIEDPNDPESSFAVVSMLQQIAIEHDAVVITVLHENPNSEYGKTRGHLGSQLERKAEANLRLHKDNKDGVTTIYTEKSRHCHIPKEQGSRFRWDDDLGMHRSCETKAEEKELGRIALLEQEADLLVHMCESRTFTYKEAILALGKINDVQERSAINHLKKLQENGLLTQEMDTGKYHRSGTKD